VSDRGLTVAGEGDVIWLTGDVLLYGFLALPDGLLPFRGVLPEPRKERGLFGRVLVANLSRRDPLGNRFLASARRQ